MLEPFQTNEHVVLKNQNALVFIFLLNFQGHILFQDLVVCLVNETERPLAQFLLQVESFRYF